jgi:TonB family protein
MFQNLIASGHPHRLRLDRYLLSLGFHSLTIAGAVALTRHQSDATVFRPLQTNPVLVPAQPRQAAQPSGEHAVSLQPAPLLSSGHSAFEIPHLSLSPLPAAVTTIADLVNASAESRGLRIHGTAPLQGTGLQSAASVDDPVTVVDQAAPQYPPSLAQAGITGRVELEYVVDTLGHVEPGSVRTVVSTRPEFELEARTAALGSRFRPARLRGYPVRQLVRQMFTFRMQ